MGRNPRCTDGAEKVQLHERGTRTGDVLHGLRVLGALLAAGLADDGGVLDVSGLAGLLGEPDQRVAPVQNSVGDRGDRGAGQERGRQASRNSLLSDLANLTERNTRLAGHVARLEQRLSEAFGQDAWRALVSALPSTQTLFSGKIDHLEQQVAELRDQLSEREEDLRAS